MRDVTTKFAHILIGYVVMGMTCVVCVQLSQNVIIEIKWLIL